MSNETSFLFSRPSFLEGFGRLFDFPGTLDNYNQAPSAEDADQMALTMDWMVVGQEISQAAGRLQHQ